MSITDENQRKVNDLVQIVMENFTVEEIQELQYQLTEFLGVLAVKKAAYKDK